MSTRTTAVAALWEQMVRLPARTPEELARTVYAAPRPCGSRPDLFDPDADPARLAQAQAVCADCPVRAACAALAMTPTDPVTVLGDEPADDTVYAPHGVYGGLSPEERRALAPAWRVLLPARPARPVVRPVGECVVCGLRLSSRWPKRYCSMTCRLVAEKRAARARRRGVAA